MATNYLAKLTREGPAAEELIVGMAAKVAKKLKVDGRKIPADYLAFLRASNGAAGNVGDEGAYLRLHRAEEVAKLSDDYGFAPRGWLLIGNDGAGTGYGINLDVEPAEYIEASFIDRAAVYRGATLAQLLESLAMGDLPKRPGEPREVAAGGDAGVVASMDVRGAFCVGFAGDGHLLLLTKRGAVLAEIDAAAQRTVREIAVPLPEGPRRRLAAAALTADGATAVLYIVVEPETFPAPAEGRLVTVDTKSGKVLREVVVAGGCRSIKNLAVVAGGEVMLQAAGAPIRFFAVGTLEEVRALVVPTDASSEAQSVDRPAAVSPDGRLLAIVDPRRKILVLYDVATGTEVKELTGGVRAFSWSADGQTLVLGMDSPEVRVVRVSDGGTVASVLSSGSSFVTPVMTRDGRILAMQVDGLRVWNGATGVLLALVPGWAERMGLAADEKTVGLWSDSEKMARVVRLPAAGSRGIAPPVRLDAGAAVSHEVACVPGQWGTIEQVVAAGKTVVTDSLWGTATVWDAETWKVHAVMKHPVRGIRSLGISKDGRQVLGVYRGLTSQGTREDTDAAVYLWDAVTGKELGTLTMAKVARGVFAAGGVMLGMDDRRILRWDAACGIVTPIARAQAIDLHAFAASADGVLVAGGGEGMIELFDGMTGAPVGAMEAKEGTPWHMSVSGDRKWLTATYLPDEKGGGRVALFDLAKKKQVRLYKTKEDWMGEVVWLAGDEEFVVGTLANEWDAYRYSIKNVKRLETLSVDMVGNAMRTVARVGENILVTGGDANWALRVWQLVKESKGSTRSTST